jgi:hypothetical protein
MEDVMAFQKFGQGEIVGQTGVEGEDLQGISLTAQRELVEQHPSPADAVELARENQES